jgi:hypothetical protein
MRKTFFLSSVVRTTFPGQVLTFPTHLSEVSGFTAAARQGRECL